VNDDLGKEVILESFKAFSQNLLAKTGENHEKPQ